ncbi:MULTISPECIES: FAD-dependent oxidoreductase [unclassified Novosphingobium]|uniref:FAD-dependent oxidoreductase n=1 Tax=unclassified Novosphingobium TaxID=2644732 RepID=UPI00146D9E42|nr:MULTISPECIES: FAD-dependent oxidoreductase [unclassified Novosphingobium]NMN04795.1 thioredoxin reductase [Novosphingobium sp. SG919]NMN85211.1 thioredoxin reductase [Novosphingobium sp. SG916]
MSAYDVAIVGGGPAGLAAAERTLAAGLSTCIVDEQQRPGGQILRQPPATFAVAGWLDGAPYRQARALLARVAADKALHWRGGVSVLGIAPDADGFVLSLSDGCEGLRDVRARRVLVAGGCYDMPVALPGWTLPGVMSAGAVQTLVKAQQVLPGQRIVLFGTHPLMIVLAQQIVAAGGRVDAVCFAQPFAVIAKAALAHLARALWTPAPLLAAAAGLAALRRSGVPVRFSAPVVRCEGSDQGVMRVVIAGTHGEEALACDVAAQCYGFLPQADLVRQIGARVRWSGPAGGWEAVHDDAMRASVPGLYVAGETTGVAGSDAAMVEGALAGIGMARDAGALGEPAAQRAMRQVRRARARMQGFIDLLRAVADPCAFLPEAAGETLLCRCEDVSAGAVDAAIADAGHLGQAYGASAIKLRCRAGMGLCQGRSCEHALIRRIAAARGCAERDVAGFRARFPARAVSIADMLDGPA